jgi:cobalamin biosynthesis Mg chelatase CobN
MLGEIVEMLKMKKNKILVSLLLVAVIAILFGNVVSSATEITANTTNSVSNSTGTGSVTITASTSNTTGTNSTTISANTSNTSSIVNAAINSSVSTYNSLANNTTTLNANSNTETASSLPYTGSGNIFGAIVLAVVLVVSAVYAYKKVTDYNV